MEADFIFIDENDDNLKKTFHRKLYYNLICSIIIDFFGKTLVDNDFHKYFVDYLNHLKDFDDVYFLTSETAYYWAICIIENNKTNTQLNNKQLQEYSAFYRNFLHENKISKFIE